MRHGGPPPPQPTSQPNTHPNTQPDPQQLERRQPTGCRRKCKNLHTKELCNKPVGLKALKSAWGSRQEGNPGLERTIPDRTVYYPSRRRCVACRNALMAQPTEICFPRDSPTTHARRTYARTFQKLYGFSTLFMGLDSFENGDGKPLRYNIPS